MTRHAHAVAAETTGAGTMLTHEGLTHEGALRPPVRSKGYGTGLPHFVRTADFVLREPMMLVTIGPWPDWAALAEKLEELFSEVMHFSTWSDARALWRSAGRALLVASPGMSRQDLFEMSRTATADKKLMLLGMDDSVDRVVCLNMGADEALASATSLHEICARARRLLRPASVQPLKPGGRWWEASVLLRSLTTPEGVRIGLSPAEWSCLMALAAHPEQLITVQDAVPHVRGLAGAADPEARLRVQMSRLRRRLAPHFAGDPVVSVYGAGYTLAIPVRLTD